MEKKCKGFISFFSEKNKDRKKGSRTKNLILLSEVRHLKEEQYTFLIQRKR